MKGCIIPSWSFQQNPGVGSELVALATCLVLLASGSWLRQADKSSPPPSPSKYCSSKGVVPHAPHEPLNCCSSWFAQLEELLDCGLQETGSQCPFAGWMRRPYFSPCHVPLMGGVMWPVGARTNPAATVPRKVTLFYMRE